MSDFIEYVQTAEGVAVLVLSALCVVGWLIGNSIKAGYYELKQARDQADEAAIKGKSIEWPTESP